MKIQQAFDGYETMGSLKKMKLPWNISETLAVLHSDMEKVISIWDK